jgi:hypothetical protein
MLKIEDSHKAKERPEALISDVADWKVHLLRSKVYRPTPLTHPHPHAAKWEHRFYIAKTIDKKSRFFVLQYWDLNSGLYLQPLH